MLILKTILVCSPTKTLNDTNTYISGDASSITIDADDTLNLVSDTIIEHQ